MKRLLGFSILAGVLFLQSAYALIEIDPDYPFHFREVVNREKGEFKPFFLISKSAYRLLDENTPWDEFINEAKAKGFNSFRIWLMWPYWMETEGDDRCNEFRVWPWQYPALYGYPWFNHFSDAYWNRLRDVLEALKAEGIEAQLCIFDWGSLSRLPWNPDYPYDGTAEGTKFLYIDPALNGDSYPPPPDKRLQILLDKIIYEARTWPDNWRLEIGNHISDPFNHHTWTPCVDSDRFPKFIGNMAPNYNENDLQRRIYYEDWINSISSYLRRKLDENGLVNPVTHSSPNGRGDHQTAEETFWAKNHDWNQPIEFHGSRVNDWYVDNYNRYYQFIRKEAPPAAGRPVIDGEPKTYGFESGYSFANFHEARWNFYIGAMAGCYPTYHSVKARNLELDDDGDHFMPTFSAILQWGDVDFNTGQALPSEWFKMSPDFDDASFENARWLDEPIGFAYAGPMTRQNVFPLLEIDRNSGSAMKGFIYFLRPEADNATITTEHLFVLNQDMFPSGNTYRFTWFHPDDLSQTEQFEQCMSPGSRFLRFPDKIVQRLNSEARDAIVHIKRIDQNCTMSPAFCDNFLDAHLILNQTKFTPGDQFRLKILTQLKVPDDTLFAELLLVVHINGCYYYFPEWRPEQFDSSADFLTSGNKTILEFQWPDTYSGEAVTVDVFAAFIEPQQFSRSPSNMENPGLKVLKSVQFTFSE